jgi:toxin-antitoxin system PIN domain toxin
MLIDANLLLYAVDEASPHHGPAATWLAQVLNGDERVGLPWQSLGAFLRISTHPRATPTPLTATQAWSWVHDWLEADPTWIPPATERTAATLARLVERHQVSGNLIPDAQLAALAMEHGLVVCSTDTDFGLFDEIRWLNPIAARPG